MATPEIIPSICSNAAVRRASRRLGQLYDDVLAPSGLRATQYNLLVQIDRADGPSMAELAENLVMDPSAFGHSLAPLRRDGYVALTLDKRDRRGKRVTLTDAGRAKLAEARRLWRDAQVRFDAAFGADEAAALRQALDRLSSREFAASFTGSPSAG